MKSLLPFLILSLLGLILAGCSASQAEDDHHHSEAATAAHFKEGHGVRLSPAAATFVGLATTEIVAPPPDAMPTIPTAALLRTAKGDFVYAVNGDWYLRTAVTVGATRGDRIEIRDGLYEGDIVVSAGAQALWLAELQAVNGGVGCADGH